MTIRVLIADDHTVVRRGVAQILADPELAGLATVVVLCANDPVGAWGAQRVMQEQFGLPIDVVSGPTTDNAVGVRYVREQLGLEALNARTHGAELGEFVACTVAQHSTQVQP